jgi:ribosomal protein RSM22 (predicted rRNA methylase)
MKIQIEKMFKSLEKNENSILENFDDILQNIKPLSSKQLYQLPVLIKELSHQLTDERSSRHNGYMNQTVMLTAYSRYFMWWNLFRLTNLFRGFPKNCFDFLKDDDYCLDLGSGPLTIPVALWLSRPELRKKKLTWYCVDISQTALSLGEEIFLSIVAKTLDNENENIEPWKIIRVKGELGTEIRNKASFVTCANMFNELYYDTAKPLEEQAKKYTNTLISYATEKSMILVVEPAFPRSSRFISLTRDALIRKKYSIISPCPHTKECCMDGRRGGKWCHFVLNTDFAPKKLHKLSDKAGLPKDRASLSFVFAQNFEEIQNDELKIRVVSDMIKLPQNATGRYACSKLGLTLVKSNFTNSKKFDSGSLISTEEPTNKIESSAKIDAKSGAKIIEV